MKQIADHILTLQHSLVYYERMLSDWNPTYIAQLGAEISIAKNKADVNLLYVTTVAVCCSTNLIVIGRLTVFCIRTYSILIHFLRCILPERQCPKQSPCRRTPLLLVYWHHLYVNPRHLHITSIGPSLVEAVKAKTFHGLGW